MAGSGTAFLVFTLLPCKVIVPQGNMHYTFAYTEPHGTLLVLENLCDLCGLCWKDCTNSHGTGHSRVGGRVASYHLTAADSNIHYRKDFWSITSVCCCLSE
jgi:hypothetical protein